MSKTKLEFRLEVAEAIAADLGNVGLDYSAGVIRELIQIARGELVEVGFVIDHETRERLHLLQCPACDQVRRVRREHRTPPELGAIHANGGHPEHVPFGVYEDGRA